MKSPNQLEKNLICQISLECMKSTLLKSERMTYRLKSRKQPGVAKMF